MFEEQYGALASAKDELAERIRALGHRAPGSFGEFKKLTRIADETGAPAAMAMVRQLLGGHEAVIGTIRAAFPAAEKGNDEATCDLLTERLDAHEKTAWMLRAMLE